jgi:hypothetical protein
MSVKWKLEGKGHEDVWVGSSRRVRVYNGCYNTQPCTGHSEAPGGRRVVPRVVPLTVTARLSLLFYSIIIRTDNVGDGTTLSSTVDWIRQSGAESCSCKIS